MKTTKTAISIPVDVLEQAKQRAKEMDMNFSAYVTGCIRQALGAPDSGPASSYSPFFNNDLNEIWERLTRLESMMIVIPPVIPEVIPEVIPDLTYDKRGRIIITEDMKIDILSRVDTRMRSGMDQKAVADLIGLSGNDRISKVRSGAIKSLTPEEYKKYMIL